MNWFARCLFNEESLWERMGYVSHANDLVGERLGDYRLISKLASGGMAEIYVGEDVTLQRKAAIKILTPEKAGDDALLAERFMREARAIAQLEHDNIIPIYQFGQRDRLYFIAMRFIEGNDLADELKRYRERGKLMPIKRALPILEQIAAALDYAHQYDIIHRDVKPSNVLLGLNDRAWLSDFGLVLWQSMDQTLGTAFGTPRYISPEQATDSQSAVPQSDVYSLAVIVYEILTGQVMFDGQTPMEIALSHITATPPRPRRLNPEIPPAAQKEVMKALDKNPTKRHQTATEFVQALKKAYGGNTIFLADEPEEDLDTGTVLLTPTQPVHAPAPPRPASGSSNEDTPPSRNADSMLRQWDEEPIPGDETSETITGPSVPKRPGRLPLPVLGGGAIAVLVAVLVALGVFNDDAGTSGDTVQLELHYNEYFFAIVNVHPFNADLSSLRIEGESGERSATDFGSRLASGGCIVIRLSSAQDQQIPDDWGCNVRSRTTVSQPVYWRADSESDEHFTLYNGAQQVATCDTYGRAVGRTNAMQCTLRWPVVAREE